jgi:hypothetical protein
MIHALEVDQRAVDRALVERTDQQGGELGQLAADHDHQGGAGHDRPDRDAEDRDRGGHEASAADRLDHALVERREQDRDDEGHQHGVCEGAHEPRDQGEHSDQQHVEGESRIAHVESSVAVGDVLTARAPRRR